MAPRARSTRKRKQSRGDSSSSSSKNGQRRKMLKQWEAFRDKVEPFFKDAIKLYNTPGLFPDKVKYTKSGFLRVQDHQRAGSERGMDVADDAEDVFNVIVFLAVLCWAACRGLPLEEIYQAMGQN